MTSLIDKRYSRKERVFNCSFCGKEYFLFVSDYLVSLGRYRKNCSRKCSNKANWTNGYLTVNEQRELDCIDCGVKIKCNRRALKKRCEKCNRENRIKKYSSKKYKKIDNRFCKSCNKTWKGNGDKFICDECRTSYYKFYAPSCKFSFNLKDYKDYFDFSLLKKYGMYSPTNRRNNLKGVSRDHKLSVKQGFDLKIDPVIVRHPANCRLIQHTENQNKRHRSIITLDELLDSILRFEDKYHTKNELEVRKEIERISLNV